MKKLFLILILLLLVACKIQEQSKLTETKEQTMNWEENITKPFQPNMRNLYIEEGTTFHTEINELPVGTALNIVNQDTRSHYFSIELIQENGERKIKHYKSKRIDPGDSYILSLEEVGELRIVDVWFGGLRTILNVTEVAK